MYTVRLERQVRKVLATVHDPDYSRLRAAINALSQNPRPSGCIKLTGYDAWRIRVGTWRIVYEIDDTTSSVMVVDVGRRSNVYR